MGYSESNDRTDRTKSYDTPLKGVVISGLDITEGLELLGGDEDAYIKVLRSYATSSRALVSGMEMISAQSSLSDYAMAVHSLKGASFSVGALRAGIDAERLERWAKAGNSDKVLTENPSFVAYMQTLLAAIDIALKDYDSRSRKPVAAAPDPALLKELREACKAYDAGIVDSVMEKLGSFEYESGSELVAWLSGQVEEMNYKTIATDIWPA